MPFDALFQEGILYTTVSGNVSDAELLAYYSTLPGPPGKIWLELVDASSVRTMQFTRAGYRQLQKVLSEKYGNVLHGGRVAMVAANDATYGLFRMWELQREDLGYHVRVFRDRGAALAWLQTPGEGDRTSSP